MNKRDLKEGSEYVIATPGGGRRHARLLLVDRFWSTHSMEITHAPESSKHYSIGEVIGVHSKSIKHALTFVIHEEP